MQYKHCPVSRFFVTLMLIQVIGVSREWGEQNSILWVRMECLSHCSQQHTALMASTPLTPKVSKFGVCGGIKTL